MHTLSPRETPCNACHTELTSPRLWSHAELKSEIVTLGAALVEIEREAPQVRSDARFQEAQRLLGVASVAVTETAIIKQPSARALQEAGLVLQAVQSFSDDLRRDFTAGTWTVRTRRAPRFEITLPPAPLRSPVVWQSTGVFADFSPHIDRHLSAFIILMLMACMGLITHRRAPPAEAAAMMTIQKVSLRRLPPVVWAGQSPFYFCDRSGGFASGQSYGSFSERKVFYVVIA